MDEVAVAERELTDALAGDPEFAAEEKAVVRMLRNEWAYVSWEYMAVNADYVTSKIMDIGSLTAKRHLLLAVIETVYRDGRIDATELAKIACVALSMRRSDLLQTLDHRIACGFITVGGT